MTGGERSFRRRSGPSNNEMQRTKHGSNGASPLISVFGRREREAWHGGVCVTAGGYGVPGFSSSARSLVPVRPRLAQ